MIPTNNATSMGRPQSINFSNSELSAQKSMAGKVLRTGNSSQRLAVAVEVSIRSNADIAPPVLACNAFERGFTSQADLDFQWSALKDMLRTQSLPEPEALEVLSSGILQTETGKAIAGLFADAMLRSVRPLGTLTAAQLKSIIDVVSYLPPGQWQAAFGENARFARGLETEGVAGFIQSQLDRSGALRDEQIANNELLSDIQWDALKQITEHAGKFIRSSSGFAINDALAGLKEAYDVRPSPKDAETKVTKFIEAIRTPLEGERVRWPDGYLNGVEAVYDQHFKLAESVKQTWLAWVIGPSWLEGVLGRPESSPVSSNSPKSKANTLSSNGDTSSLLLDLQRFESAADRYSNVSTTGPRIPKTFIGRFLWACNALDTVGALRLDSSHITTRPRATVQTELPAADLPTPPIDLSSDVLPFTIPSVVTLEHFAAQADEVVNRFINKMLPWNSAYADDLKEVVVMLDPLKIRVENPAIEHSHSSASWGYTPSMEALGEQLGQWLGTMSGTLISTGVAVMSRTGDLIERYPRSAVGMFATYMTVSTFYANWFGPEPKMVDPSREGVPELEVMPDETALIHEAILEDVEDLFEEEPDFTAAIAQLVSQSEYLNPVDDPQLIEDVEALLQQSYPDIPDMTYQSLLEEMFELSTLDVEGEQEDDLDAEDAAHAQVTTSANPPLDSAEMASVRKKRGIDGSLLEATASIGGRVIAKAVIEVSNRRLQENTLLQQSDEEIAPGITVNQAAEKVIATFKAAQTISDPYKFLADSISNLFHKHSSLGDIAAGITPNTTVSVVYGKINLFPPRLPDIEIKKFTLAEVSVDAHLRGSPFNERVTVAWPNGISLPLRDAIASANFQDDYNELIKEVVNRPDIAELWKLKKEKDVKLALNSYLKAETRSAEGAKIANDFLTGDLKGQLVYANSSEKRKLSLLSDAIYLPGKFEYGLLVLLTERKVIEVPSSWVEGEKEAVIPSELKKDIADRMTINDNYGRVDADYETYGPFKHEGRYYWFYEPLIPSGYPDENIIDTLYKVQIDKVLSDIDALVSTGWERLGDAALDASGKLLLALSIAVGFVPVVGVPTAMVSRAAGAFLLGLASTGTDAVRAVLADDPATKQMHEKNALRGVIMDFAGPLASKILGSVFTKVARSKITNKVLVRLDLKGTPRTLARQLNDVPKWIPPKIRSYSKIRALMDRKFRNYNVIDRLNRLGRGPHVAQKLMKQTGVRYFANAQSGYVYEGFLMRGEKVRVGMTSKESMTHVFENGFELTHPIKNVRQANGMNGGHGGGKNQADPDGRGISTSPYHSNGGAGAHYYGAGRLGEEGLTYLIDARGMKGYDLYANQYFASQPPIKMGSKPWEINFAEKIPGGRVLGAYDKAGKFWPNMLALQNSIHNSIPIMDSSIHGLVKPLVRSTNATLAANPAV